MNRKLKLGRKVTSPPDDRDLRFAKYRDAATPLPPVPHMFGFEREIPRTGWGMLGNDEYGDCVWAMKAHRAMVHAAANGRELDFTTAGVLSDYSAQTGFDPGDPDTDQGTVIRDSLNYERQTGIVDAGGERHKIRGYVRVDPQNHAEVWEACYLFGAVDLGIAVPFSAMDQFEQGRMWSYVPGSPIEGGHGVPLIARRSHWGLVTWGQVQWCGHRFFERYCDEAWAILSDDWLDATGGKSPQGFDLDALLADLEQIGQS